MSETILIGNDICPHCAARHSSNYDCRAVTHSLLKAPETPKSLTQHEIEMMYDHCAVVLGGEAYGKIRPYLCRIGATIATQAAALASAKNDALEEVLVSVMCHSRPEFNPIGPLYGAGWAAASEFHADQIRALKAPPIPAEGAK